VKPSLDHIVEPLNVNLLGVQQSMFKLTMKAQAIKARAKPFNMNLVTKLWMTIIKNSLLCQRLSEYMKITKITIILCTWFNGR
jgi:hypothetical protein